MDRHEVIGLPPGVRELLLQVGFKALVPQSPVPLLPYLAQVLPQLGSSSINCWSEAKRALGSRSRHLLTTLLNTGGIDESTSTSGTAGSCVRFTRLAIALSA